MKQTSEDKRLIKISKLKLDEQHFDELVDIVKSELKQIPKETKDFAFGVILARMKNKIKSVVSQFNIRGMGKDDIEQEALKALRFKAVLDYKKGTIGRNNKPYPFDNFAMIVIKRYLSTIAKTSKQNKSKVLNTSISIDQDVNDDDDENLSLSNILYSSDTDVSEELMDDEYFQRLYQGLFGKLSKLEKMIFSLYLKNYTYEEMAEVINKEGNLSKPIDVKSVDNALSRIKLKAVPVYDEYGEGRHCESKKKKKKK